MKSRVCTLEAYSADTASGLWALLGGNKLTESLPTKQEMAQTYAMAVVAFWVVGGITLYLVSQFSKSKK